MLRVKILFLLLLFPLSCSGAQEKMSWLKIDKGLYFTEIATTKESLFGKAKYSVLKIDPRFYEFTLLSATQHGKKSRTARQWAEEFSCIAAINAGMYQQDGLTNVGFMKNYKHFNNPHLRKDYKSMFAFNPLNKSLPAVQILDRQCQGFNKFKNKYQTLIQNIRMISCKQKNVWQQQNKQWSIAAVAIDKSGNVLFIHSRKPYSVHDFNRFLLQSSLNIYNAMYVEGGPEASLFISDKKTLIEKMGSYETGFTEHNKNAVFWPIPNVIAIRKKK